MSAVLLSIALLSAPTPPGKFDWPQWRGPNRDGVSQETGLLKKWPDGGPPKLWTATDLGGGYGTPSVVGNRVFGVGKFDDPTKKGTREAVWAVDADTRKVVWSTPFADSPQRVGYGEGPRSTPTYHDGKLYVVATAGDLACLDAESGKVVWQKSLVKDFGGSVQSWGFCESVLIDDGKLICTPGSESAAVVALDPADGRVIWKAAVPRPGGAGGYSSPVRVEIGGVPMYVNLLGKSGGVVGVHAKTGKLLWQYTKTANGTANIPTVVGKGDLLFVTSGYADGGSAVLRLKKDGDGVKAEEVKYFPGRELQNHHGGVVLVGDHLYLGRGHNNGLPTCVELATANIKWKEDRGAGGGSGSGCVTAADGMLYFRYQNGVMALVKATPDGFELAGRFDIPDKSGKPSWPHPVVANGKLLVRDQDKMHAFDVKAK